MNDNKVEIPPNRPTVLDPQPFGILISASDTLDDGYVKWRDEVDGKQD